MFLLSSLFIFDTVSDSNHLISESHAQWLVRRCPSKCKAQRHRYLRQRCQGRVNSLTRGKPRQPNCRISARCQDRRRARNYRPGRVQSNWAYRACQARNRACRAKKLKYIRDRTAWNRRAKTLGTACLRNAKNVERNCMTTCVRKAKATERRQARRLRDRQRGNRGHRGHRGHRQRA